MKMADGGARERKFARAALIAINFAGMADDEIHFPGPDPNAWDADDPRRKNDCFAPPTEPCECYCLHCERVFSSDGIWFQRFINKRDGDLDGVWLCPTNNCDGAGFTFDIFPTDPEHPANAGWVECDEDEEEFVDNDEADRTPAGAGHFADDDIPFGALDDTGDVIIEGDEWKLGYAPDEPAPQSIYGSAEERAEQSEFDQPDERPRVIDMSKRPPRETSRDDDRPKGF